MFGWQSKEHIPVEAVSSPDIESLRQQEIAVVFKHSRSCPTSWAAQRQVKTFETSNPEVPVYTVHVRQDRELSRQIAAFTGVRHESPQVIVLRRGEAISAASHEGVTADFLTRAVAGTPSPV